MKKSIFPILGLAVLWCGQILHAQTTAFTYQGRLNNNGSVANGIYDIRFTIYDAVTNGNAVSISQTNSATSVSDGLFTAQLDFGASVFNGNARWLDIGVRTNGNPGAFTFLAPRQPLTSAPYAIQAANAVSATTAATAGSVSAANIAGTIPLAQLPSTIITNGATGVNITGSFSGDGYGIHNVMVSSLAQARIVGLGDNSYGQTTIPQRLDSAVRISVGDNHCLVLKKDGTVVGWGYNAQGQTTIPAGLSNVVAIAAGNRHSLGLKNDGTVVGWGWNDFGQVTIPAGLSNVLAIAGGESHSLALKRDGTVVGWGWNDFGQVTIPAGLSNVVAIAAGATYSLGLKSDGTVAGWGNNGDGQTTIPAGLSNVVAIEAGRYHSLALKNDGTVVGWGWNDYDQTTIPAGLSNVVAIAAGYYHSIVMLSVTASPALLDQDNTFTGNLSVNGIISGNGAGLTNLNAVNINGTIADARLSSNVALLSNGKLADATLSSNVALLSNGKLPDTNLSSNVALLGANQTFGGVNVFQNAFDAVSLRVTDGASGNIGLQTLGGGNSGFQAINFNGLYSVGSEVRYNTNKARWRMIVDQRNATDLFTMEVFRGGALFAALSLTTNGNLTTGGTVNGTSDKNVKTNFAAIDVAEILEKVTTLPLSTWVYKADDQTRHIGPVAQDFYSSFGVGTDDKHISMVDADGVALAAIQGLNQKVEEQKQEIKGKETEIEHLRQENLEVKRRLEQLEKRMGRFSE